MGLSKVFKKAYERADKGIEKIENSAGKLLLDGRTVSKPIIKKTRISVNLAKLGVYN